MDIERPHRTTTTTSELFICFTSRLTKSSSMRLSSKSIQSPAHTTTETTTSKPTTTTHSLSRRLRHNRSLRGAQSPSPAAMFPSSSKKNRGSSVFTTENPEPSSPKVTCIGQVRVKTRKQGKKMKIRASRNKALTRGEVSFRHVETTTINSDPLTQTQTQTQNQRWVHLPLTICEALRAFGSEFSCLFPCKSSCFSSGICGGEKEREKERENGGGNSCAVFRWLVSLQEGEEQVEGGKRRDIELVVGEEEEVLEREVVMERECSRRRSIFDDMEFDDLFQKVDNGSRNSNGSCLNGKSGEIAADDDEEGDGVCVPPKNALLLMRCRSDPMKMASLSRKLWDPPLVQDDDGDGDDEVEEDERGDVVVMKVEDVVNEVEEKTEELQGKTEYKIEELVEGKTEEVEGETEELEEKTEVIKELLESNVENLAEFVSEEEKIHEEAQRETEQKHSMENRGSLEDEKGEIFEENHVIEDEVLANVCSIESITEEDMVENGENEEDLVISNLELLFEEEEEEASNEFVISESNNNSASNEEQVVKEERENAAESSEMSTISSTTTSLNSSEESTAESKFEEEEEEEEKPTKVEEEFQQQKPSAAIIVREEEERKTSLSSMEEENNEEEAGKLPDCLLLMMCEPKLSMEVSKETWVCSTDFIRWLPERHHSKKTTKMEGSDETAMNNKKKKPAAVGPVQVPVQQGRSSISFPAGSVANLIEKKLMNTGAYEPLVLTRCKSAPIRPTGKISAPEMACGRKIEPHRPATFGVGF